MKYGYLLQHRASQRSRSQITRLYAIVFSFAFLFILSLIGLTYSNIQHNSALPTGAVQAAFASNTSTMASTHASVSEDLSRRQWDAPLTPEWPQPTPVWTEPAWTESTPSPVRTEPVWTPSPVSPTTTPSASTTTFNQPISDSPKQIMAHQIIAGVIVGSFFAAGIVGCIITVVYRKYRAWKPKHEPQDIELASVPSHSDADIDKLLPSIPAPTRSARPHHQPTVRGEQSTHWPPEDVANRTIRWDRDGGFVKIDLD